MSCFHLRLETIGFRGFDLRARSMSDRRALQGRHSHARSPKKANVSPPLLRAGPPPPKCRRRRWLARTRGPQTRSPALPGAAIRASSPSRVRTAERSLAMSNPVDLMPPTVRWAAGIFHALALQKTPRASYCSAEFQLKFDQCLTWINAHFRRTFQTPSPPMLYSVFAMFDRARWAGTFECVKRDSHEIGVARSGFRGWRGVPQNFDFSRSSFVIGRDEFSPGSGLFDPAHMQTMLRCGISLVAIARTTGAW